MIVISCIVSRITQKFLGGALSSLAGMQIGGVKKANFLGEMTGWGKKPQGDFFINNYESALYDKSLFGNPFFDKGLSYGINRTLTNFAYTNWKDYKKISLGAHLRSFGVSFVNGMGQFSSFYFKDNSSMMDQLLPSFLMNSMDYAMNTGFITQYSAFTYYQKERKSYAFALKSVVLSLPF